MKYRIEPAATAKVDIRVQRNGYAITSPQPPLING